jgi:hypothetical protein
MYAISYTLARLIMKPPKGPSRRERHFAQMDRLLARRVAEEAA